MATSDNVTTSTTVEEFEYDEEGRVSKRTVTTTTTKSH